MMMDIWYPHILQGYYFFCKSKVISKYKRQNKVYVTLNYLFQF